MPVTAQNLLDQARGPLFDTPPARWLDPELLGFLNQGIKLLRAKRPDIFIGTLGSDIPDLVVGDTVPLNQMYHAALSDYVTARALMKNSEAGSMPRANAFFALVGSEV